MGKVKEKTEEIAKPVVKSLGLELIEVVFVKEGSDWILRVFIDNPQGELKIGDCEKISRMLSDRLDSKNPIDKSYILEVSSPGIERPLKSSKDFRENSGEMIHVTTYAPVKGKKDFTGKLSRFKDNTVYLQIIDKNQTKGVVKIPLNKISNAHLTIDA